MGQVLHANARTTGAVRREIRNSEESLAKAAKRFNVNPKTILKWRKREDTKDLPMGPKRIKSTVLLEAEEEAIVAFRKMTELPLDDVLYSLQETIPHLRACSRSVNNGSKNRGRFLYHGKYLGVQPTLATALEKPLSPFNLF